MARRNRGLDAVFLRADGRWEGQIRIGGGRRRSFYARTRRDLVHKLADARWTLGEGLPVSAGTQSLRAFLEYWLVVCRTRLRPITLVTYARDVRRLTAVLGDIPLRKLTPGLIQSGYAALPDQGFSKRTVEKTHAVLHRAMDQAMHWGLTTRNPTELVSPPRPVRREMTALTGSQFGQLLRLTDGSRWYPLWVLLGTSGLRVREALGLLWSDVDLDAGRLAVRPRFSGSPESASSWTLRRRRRVGEPSTFRGSRSWPWSNSGSASLKSGASASDGSRPAWSSPTGMVTPSARASSIGRLPRRCIMPACPVSGSTTFDIAPPACCWKQARILRWFRTSWVTARFS